MATTVITKLIKVPWQKFWSPTTERGLLQAGESGLKRLGPAGDTLVGMLRQYTDRFETRVGSMSMEYEKLLTPIREKLGALAEHVADLRRTKVATDPDVIRFNNFNRLHNESMYQEAQQVGIKVGPRVADDWHLTYDPEMFKGMSHESALRHLVNTGQASSITDAEKTLSRAMSLSKGGKVHTLESARRINLPGAREDFGVMLDHFAAASRRIEQAKMFGPEDEILNQTLDMIRQTHGKAGWEYARMVANNTLHRGAGGASVMEDYLLGYDRWSKLAGIEAMAHLSLAVLNHVMQPLNTVIFSARSGLRPALEAIRDMVVDHGNANEFGLRTGAAITHTIHELRQALKIEHVNAGDWVLKGTGFNWVDKQRRIFAANVGKHMLEQEFFKLSKDPADRMSRATVKLMGLNPDDLIRRGLQDADFLQAGKRVSDLTQFRTTALDIPPAWRSNPLIRLAMMYKQFYHNQARFIKDQVFKPALEHGEYRPLAAMALLFPTFGEIAADIRELPRKGNIDERPKEILDRMLDNYSHVGGFGIIGDIVNSLAEPRADVRYRFLTGPLLADVVDLWGMPSQKHPVEAVEKKITASIPVFGSYIRRQAWPPNPTMQHKTPWQRGVATKAVKNLYQAFGE